MASAHSDEEDEATPTRARPRSRRRALGCSGPLLASAPAMQGGGADANRWLPLPPRVVMFNYVCPINTIVMRTRGRGGSVAVGGDGKGGRTPSDGGYAVFTHYK